MRYFTDNPLERMMMQVPRITDTEPKPPLNVTDTVKKKRDTRRSQMKRPKTDVPIK